jgi:hypothetical protein
MHMTREEAIALRVKHLCGEPVKALELQEAVIVIQSTAKRTGRPYKFKLPAIRALEREKMNACLLYRLGMALGRIEERKAA